MDRALLIRTLRELEAQVEFLANVEDQSAHDGGHHIDRWQSQELRVAVEKLRGGTDALKVALGL